MIDKRMKNYDNLKGGLYGLLIGDALGVPYEFHDAEEIPPYEEIEMTPPAGFQRAHVGVEAGTWSDDGAQALCLLDSIVTCGKFCLKDFSDRLLAWYQEGKWAVDLDAHNQCLITHRNLCNQVCCALYCLVARALLTGLDFDAALRKALCYLRNIYSEMPEYEQELEWSIRPDERWEGKGSGYVVDCLRSAFMIMNCAAGYEDAVKRAIMLGDDTDTTACVTGGLAGICFGFSDIPERWRGVLRGTADVDILWERA